MSMLKTSEKCRESVFLQKVLHLGKMFLTRVIIYNIKLINGITYHFHTQLLIHLW
jgi:hypothetical protein